jgi:hypothetical protein
VGSWKSQFAKMVRTPAGHLPSPPMVAAHLFPEPAAGEPYTILIMVVSSKSKVFFKNPKIWSHICNFLGHRCEIIPEVGFMNFTHSVNFVVTNSQNYKLTSLQSNILWHTKIHTSC